VLVDIKPSERPSQRASAISHPGGYLGENSGVRSGEVRNMGWTGLWLRREKVSQYVAEWGSNKKILDLYRPGDEPGAS
jgi:hypothetical protein